MLRPWSKVLPSTELRAFEVVKQPTYPTSVVQLHRNRVPAVVVAGPFAILIQFQESWRGLLFLAQIYGFRAWGNLWPNVADLITRGQIPERVGIRWSPRVVD